MTFLQVKRGVAEENSMLRIYFLAKRASFVTKTQFSQDRIKIHEICTISSFFTADTLGYHCWTHRGGNGSGSRPSDILEPAQYLQPQTSRYNFRRICSVRIIVGSGRHKSAYRGAEIYDLPQISQTCPRLALPLTVTCRPTRRRTRRPVIKLASRPDNSALARLCSAILLAPPTLPYPSREVADTPTGRNNWPTGQQAVNLSTSVPAEAGRARAFRRKAPPHGHNMRQTGGPTQTRQQSSFLSTINISPRTVQWWQMDEQV